MMFFFSSPFGGTMMAIGMFVLLGSTSFSARAFVSHHAPMVSSPSLVVTSRTTTTTLDYSNNEHDENGASNTTAATAPLPSSVVERLRINGVSVSPKGFHVLLESTTGGRRTNNPRPLKGDDDETATPKASSDPPVLLPLKMTNDPSDAYVATSPESLTLCQLLSGVDMAGAILPPELLSRIVTGHIEDKIETMYDIDDQADEVCGMLFSEGDDFDDEDDLCETGVDNPHVFAPVLSPTEAKILQHIQNQEALKRESKLLGTASVSSSSAMPQVTLDQLTLSPVVAASSSRREAPWRCTLECALPEWKETLAIDVKADLLASLAYNYDPEASPLFTCIALALRYKAPIVLKDTPSSSAQTTQSQTAHGDAWSSPDDLDREFPQRTTVANLREQSTRVTQNIEKSFEIHKLQGALQIALKLGDTRAAEKIRAKLDEHDSMELGVDQDDGTEASSDRLDDLDQNTFQ